MDSLSGSGSALNAVVGARLNAEDRAQLRVEVEGLDIGGIRREAAENTLVDPSGGG